MAFHTKVDTVTDGDAHTYDVACTGAETGVPCWSSKGWATKKLANARAREHHEEHKGGSLTRELQAFRAGLSTDEYEADVARRVAAQDNDKLEVA